MRRFVARVSDTSGERERRASLPVVILRNQANAEAKFMKTSKSNSGGLVILRKNTSINEEGPVWMFRWGDL